MRSCKWQLAGLVRDGVWEEIQGGGVTFSISHWGLHHRKDLCDFCYGNGQSGQTWSLRCYNKCPQDRCWGDTCWGCHGAQDAISYTQRPPLPPIMQLCSVIHPCLGTESAGKLTHGMAESRVPSRKPVPSAGLLVVCMCTYGRGGVFHPTLVPRWWLGA